MARWRLLLTKLRSMHNMKTKVLIIHLGCNNIHDTKITKLNSNITKDIKYIRETLTNTHTNV